MKSLHSTPIWLAITPLIGALLFSGCSNSKSTVGESTDTMGEEANTEGTTSEDSIETATEPLMTTRVTFDITVPAYVSNALQVRLIWGDTDLNASWVGDEYWSVSADLPANTQHSLSVTFYDNNGDLELASFTQDYKTGSNTVESFQINADQFNTDQWDIDTDGTSNIDELIAGTDPLVDENALLEVRDSAGVSLGFVTDFFESRIPNQRPYYEYSEELPEYHSDGRPPSGAMQTIEINIDESGNGALSDSRLEGFGLWLKRTTYTGTRTHSNNAILWEARRFIHEDAINLDDITSSVNKISAIDEQVRRYEETYSYTYNPSDTDRQTIDDIQINLTGEIIDGTSLCQPVTGTVESEKRYLGYAETNPRTETTSIAKKVGDQYWKLKIVVTGNEPSEIEYLAQNFSSTFQCEFAEF